MISVSEGFKAAVEASIRQWRTRVLLQLSGLELEAPTFFGFSQDPACPASQLGNGVTVPSKTFAFAGERCYPADDLYPLDSSYECGFWGCIQADGDGNVDWDVFTVTYDDDSIPRVKQLKMYFDEWLGYAVDFQILWKPLGGSLELLLSVEGNDQLTWEHELDSHIEPKQFNVWISKISRPHEFFRCLEFEAGWIEDVSDRVIEWDCRKERYFTSEDTLLPNASANYLNLSLENTDGVFYQKNSESPYYDCLRANQKVWVYLPLKVSGDWEEVPVGVFYTTSWKSKRTDLKTRITLLDRAKILMQSQFTISEVFLDRKISELAEIVCQDAGLRAHEYQIDDTGSDSVIPYAWFEPVSHWHALAKLAEAEGGRVYIDEYDKVIFENRERLTSGSSVATLTYDKHFGDANDDWDEDQMRNYIVVRSTPYQEWPPVIEEVWTSPETVTIPGWGDLDIEVTFDAGECTEIRQPQLGSSARELVTAKWLEPPTATGGTIRLHNSALDDDDISAGDVYVMGKPLGAEIWRSGEEVTVPAGGELVLEVFFDWIPCIEVQAPQLGASAGDTTVDWSSGPYAFGGKIKLVNTGGADDVIDGGDIWIRGKPLEQVGTTEVKKTDDVLIRRYGKREFTFESPFLQGEALADGLAQFWLDSYKDPGAPITLEMTARGMPHLQLADKVTVQDSVKLKIDGDYWVTGATLRFHGGLDGSLELLPVGGE